MRWNVNPRKYAVPAQCTDWIRICEWLYRVWERPLPSAVLPTNRERPGKCRPPRDPLGIRSRRRCERDRWRTEMDSIRFMIEDNQIIILILNISSTTFNEHHQPDVAAAVCALVRFVFHQYRRCVHVRLGQQPWPVRVSCCHCLCHSQARSHQPLDQGPVKYTNLINKLFIINFFYSQRS